MELPDNIEKLWREGCESYEGSIMMSKSSFVICMKQYAKQVGGAVRRKCIEVAHEEVHGKGPSFNSDPFYKINIDQFIK